MNNVAKLKGARILLVEDNLLNQRLVIELLRENKIQIEVANNGAEALQLLETETFDGILMDCQMPVLDGYETTRRIRQRDNLKHLPVIAVTANAMPEDRRKALAAGMNDYIVKPIDLDAFFSKLAEWITPRLAETPELKADAETAADSQEEEGEDEASPGQDNGTRQAGMGKSLDPETLKQRLDDLKKAVNDHDIEAIDLAEELREYSFNDEMTDAVGILAKAAADYDFESAQNILKNILKTPSLF